MSHKVSYKWFRRTIHIPRFGGVLQECWDFTWRVSDCEELVVAIAGDVVNDLQKGDETSKYFT